MSSWLITAVIAVAVVALIVKRFVGEPLNARDLFVPPVVLLGIGVYNLTKLDVVDARDVAWIVGGGLVGLAFGALRGTTTVLFPRNGVLYQRYTWKTIAVWAVSLAANFGVGLLAIKAGMHPETRQMTLSIGVSLLGEMLTVGWRALASGHPFAPERQRGGALGGLLDRGGDRRTDDARGPAYPPPSEPGRAYPPLQSYPPPAQPAPGRTGTGSETLEMLGEHIRRYVQNRRR